MANGILGQRPRIAPGLDGLLAAEGVGQMRTQNNLGLLGGVLSLKNAMAQQQEMQQSAPLRQARMEAELRNLTNPAPKWQVSERFNEQTGKKEKVLVDLNNPSNIVPFGGQEARNLSFQNTGPEIVGVDPTTGQRVTSLATAATPHQAWQQTTQFPWQQQVDRANVANSAANVGIANANLFYNTGMGPLGGGGSLPRPLGTIPQPLPGMGGGAPAPAPAPRPAPAQPPLGVPPPRNAAPTAPQVIVPEGTQMRPAGSVPLSPKAQQELAVEAAKKEAELRNKREYNMGGINSALDAAESILKGQPNQFGSATAPAPTGSYVGKGVDLLGEIFGVSASGAPQAAQLKSIAGSLVAKMPRMEGPQSDKDVQMYREMAGQIGDDSVPINTRLAALKVVRDLYAKYEKPQQPQSPQAGNDPLGIRR